MSRPDVDALFDLSLRAALNHLNKRARFYPFGAALGLAGEHKLIEGWTGTDQPKSQDLLDLLWRGFEQQRADLKAIAVCFIGTVRRSEGADPTEAICVSLEHADGEAVNVFVPYRKRFLRATKLGEMWSEPATPRVFAQGTPASD